jgi:hypothetical protein
MLRDDDPDREAILGAALCCYCILFAGLLTYIVIGIYYMVVDRYVCEGTGADGLWLYSILVLTLPIGFQYLLACTVNPDAIFSRLTATAAVVAAFIIYGGIVLFGGGVCDAQKAEGGLYVWALIQFSLSCFFMLVMAYIMMNPDALKALTPPPQKAEEPLLGGQQKAADEETKENSVSDVERPL